MMVKFQISGPNVRIRLPILFSSIHCRYMEDQAWRWGHNVEITNTTEDWAALGLAGPKSRDVLSKLTNIDLATEKYPFLHAREFNVAGLPVRALRISYTGRYSELVILVTHTLPPAKRSSQSHFHFDKRKFQFDNRLVVLYKTLKMDGLLTVFIAMETRHMLR